MHMDQAIPGVFESFMDPIVQIDCDGTIRLVNPACCKCFQYEEKDLIGKNISMLMPEPYASQHGQFIQNYVMSGIPKIIEEGRRGRKLPALRRDGTTFPMFLTLSEGLVSGEKIFTGIMRNLSAEEEEKRVLLAMHNLVTSSIDPIVQIDSKGIIRLANPSCCNCFQYREEELVGKNISILMPEPYASRHNQFIENYLMTGIPKVVEKGRRGRTLPGLRKDGSTFPMFLTLSESSLHGEIIFTGIMRNLSAEEEERQVLSTMIDSCVDPIVVITTKGTIERCNPACTRVFGYSKEVLIGGNISMLMPEPHASQHQSYIDRYLTKRQLSRSNSDLSNSSHVVGQGRDLVGKRSDGTKIPLFLTISEFEVSSSVSARKGFIGIMRDMSEREKVIAIEVEKKKSEALLKNVLPHHICERLKAEEFHEDVQIADTCDNVSILFADIVGFTKFASERTPLQVVHYLNKVFRIFDVLVDKYGLEKIKTIGDAYMAVGGINEDPDHIYKIINFSLEALEAINLLKYEKDEVGELKLGIRIGLHVGSVVAGLVGTKRRFFDLWGDAVNVASRMESSGIANCVHCSASIASVAQKYPDEFIVVHRGTIEVKGKGPMETFIIGRFAKRHSISLILRQHETTKRKESMEMHRKLEEELFRDMIFSFGTLGVPRVTNRLAFGLLSFFAGVAVSTMFSSLRTTKR